MKQDAAQFHSEVVAAARRRQAKERDIKSDAEFEDFLDVLERLGEVAKACEKNGYKPELVGRTMLFYAKCIAVVAAPTPGIVPEAA